MDDKSHHLEPVMTFPADASQRESREGARRGCTSSLLTLALHSITGSHLELLGEFPVH